MCRPLKAVYFLLFVCWASSAAAAPDSIFSDTIYRQAIEQVEQGDFQKAHRLFKKLDESYPDHPVVLNNLGVVSVNLGNLETAQKLFERAIKAYLYAGVAYENLQSVYNHRAIQSYRDALSLDAPLPSLSVELIKPTLRAMRPSTQVASLQQRVLADKAVQRPLVEEPRQSQAAGSEKVDPALLKFVQGWAQAWSRKDSKGYFSHYIADYHPRSNISNASWKSRRTERLRGPKSIQVSLSSIRLKAQKDYYVATFRQDYRSNLLSSSVIKQLDIRKVDGAWKIFGERVIKRR